MERSGGIELHTVLYQLTRMSSVLICLCAFVGWRFLNYLSFVDCQTVAEEDYNELGEEGNYHHCYCHHVLVHA